MFFVASSLTWCIQCSLSWGVPSTQDTPGEPWHVCALGQCLCTSLTFGSTAALRWVPITACLPKLILYVYSKLNRDTIKQKKGFSCVYSLVGMSTCCMYEFPGSVSSSRKRKRLLRILPLPAEVVAQLVSACSTNMGTQIWLSRSHGKETNVATCTCNHRRTQIWPSESHGKEMDVATCACNHSLGEVEIGDPGTGDHQPDQIGEFQV